MDTRWAKSQELAAILIRSGFSVGAEPSVRTFCDIYRELGMDVGEVASVGDGDQGFEVLVASPSFVRGRRRSGRGRDFIIWASKAGQSTGASDTEWEPTQRFLLATMPTSTSS